MTYTLETKKDKKQELGNLKQVTDTKTENSSFIITYIRLSPESTEMEIQKKRRPDNKT